MKKGSSEMIYFLIRNYLLALLLIFPAISYSANTDYDGTWVFKFNCERLLASGGRPDGFSESHSWKIEQGAGKFESQGAGATTKWDVEIQDKKISLKGNGSRGSSTWQWQMDGIISNDSRVDFKGTMYSNGARIRDCSGNGNLTAPSTNSILSKKAPVLSAQITTRAKTISCKEAPISGPPFKECKILAKEQAELQRNIYGASSDIDTWQMSYSDSSSEFIIGFDVVRGSERAESFEINSRDVIGFLSNAVALKGITEGSSNWINYQTSGTTDTYMNFIKPSQQCMAVLRVGKKNDVLKTPILIYGAFCKKSDISMTMNETKFILDMIKVK